MRSVKIIVEGAFWDSQIYSGQLFLFDLNGDTHRINWSDAIDAIAGSNASVQTAVRVAFSDSDLFYNQKVRKILLDPQIEHPVKTQLTSLASLALEASQQSWSSHWKQSASPFNFLPTDTEIYYHQLFAAGEDGLFSTPKSASSHVEPVKHHDAATLQVKASERYTTLATAAGDDGLFEFNYRRDEYDVLDEARQLTPRFCNACEWAFQSVMGWSSESAFLASFNEKNDPRTNKASRYFDRIVEPTEMFGEKQGKTGRVWGCREKMYLLSDGHVQVSNYDHNPKPPKKESFLTGEEKQSPILFSPAGEVAFNLSSDSVVATGTAPFGTVLEFDDKLLVLRSDETVDVFNGEPVHWRVFPRADHYSNQLHIIYENRLEIISFVHDYFVDQRKKLSGFSR